MTNNRDSKQIPSLDGKSIVITGANSGLGYESAKVFAENGAKVIMACRNIAKAETARDEILSLYADAQLQIIQLDLADFESIHQFSQQFIESNSRLDILLNNAGIMGVPHHLTKHGFESQLGINHYGHFLLTGLLLNILKKTKASRVVNVSSLAHTNAKMNFNDLNYENGSIYKSMKAYGQSKLANLLFTSELNSRFKQYGIDSISLAAHPGAAVTNLGNHLDDKWYYDFLMPLVKLLLPNPIDGARSQIHASITEDAKGNEYYGPSGLLQMSGFPKLAKRSANAKNEADAQQLWEISEKLTKIKYDF